jgi:hypothetical protein
LKESNGKSCRRKSLKSKVGRRVGVEDIRKQKSAAYEPRERGVRET